MSQMMVSMILELVDRMTAPLKGATDQAEKFGKAVEQASSATPKIKASTWVEQQNAIKAAAQEANKYAGALEKVAQLSQAMAGGKQIAQAAGRIGAPVKNMLDRAAEFEKQIEELARAAGIQSQRGALSRSAIGLQKSTGVDWEEITRARRAFVEKGGGEGLTRIASIEADLVKLAFASGTDTADLYKTLFSYMDLVKMGPEAALKALQTNYLQGKAGSYELRNMVHGMPSLIGLGTEVGLKGEQITKDLVAYLQILAKMTGSPGEADTRLRHVMQKLTDPKYMERINESLGIDVSAERKSALASGENWVFRVLNLIADKMKQLDSGQAGSSTEKMGEIFKDFYIRSGVNAFAQLREQLAQYMPTPEASAKTVMEDFVSRTGTAAAAAERLAHALDAAAIKAGETQLEGRKKMNETQKGLVEKGTNLMESNPGATSGGMSLWNYGAKAAAGIGDALSAAGGIGMAYIGAKSLAERFPWLGKAGAAAGGMGKGLLSMPGNAAGAGLSRIFPNGIPMPTQNTIAGATRSLTRGGILGAATWAGEYGIDRAFEAAPKPAYPQGYNPRAELDLGIVGRFNRLMESLGVTAPAQAQQTGEAIKAGLEITAKPTVDMSDLQAALDLVNKLKDGLAGIGALARQTAGGVSRAIGASSGALHDGPDTR